MDREDVEALFADTAPFTVTAHESLVNGKTRLLADGTGNSAQPTFNFLLAYGDHRSSMSV
jgi:hypothetical protein